MAAAENAISQARSFWSVQTRSGRVVEAAGFAKAPRLGGHPGALAGILEEESNSLGLPPSLPRPPELPSQRYSNFQGWIDVATGHA